MRDDLVFDGYPLVIRRSTQSRPALVLLGALLTALISAALCSGAILDHPPAPAVPLIVIVCIGSPLFAGWEVPRALATIRAERAGVRALARFSRSLAQLPETEHPLGL